MRKSLLAGALGVVVCGPTIIAFFSGGFFDQARLLAGVVTWALVVLVAKTATRPLPTSTPGRLALAGLFLLCVWTGASIAWAPLGGRAQDDLQRLLLYLGFFFCALALLRGPGPRRWLEPVTGLGALVVVGYALSERLLPGVVELDRSLSSAGRLEQPLSYWNALGLVAAMGFLLSIRMAGDSERSRPLRAAAAAGGVPLGLGVYLTFGRGALAAVAAGLLVLLALAPNGRSQLRAAIAIVGATAVAALIANRFPQVIELERGEQGSPGDGALMLVTLVVLALVAAAVVWRPPRRALRVPAVPVPRPAAVLAGTAVALLAAMVTLAVFEGKPEGTSPARGADPTRLASVDTNRYRYWKVALDTWTSRPLVGVGSGGFLVDWLEQRDRVDTSGDAHSLYLETAAELGLVGLALLLLFLGGVAAGTVRLYRLDPAAAAGPAAVLAAWAVHAGLDWDWEMPAATLPALLFAAASIARSEELTARDEGDYRATAPVDEMPAVPAVVLSRSDARERTL